MTELDPTSNRGLLVVLGLVVLIIVVSYVGKNFTLPPSPTASGYLRAKALACSDPATLEKANERLNTNNDWLPAAALVAAGACKVFEPGLAWRMIEPGFSKSLVYVTEGGMQFRVYVFNGKL